MQGCSTLNQRHGQLDSLISAGCPGSKHKLSSYGYCTSLSTKRCIWAYMLSYISLRGGDVETPCEKLRVIELQTSDPFCVAFQCS